MIQKIQSVDNKNPPGVDIVWKPLCGVCGVKLPLQSPLSTGFNFTLGTTYWNGHPAEYLSSSSGTDVHRLYTYWKVTPLRSV
jgi:hypothetical protein